MKKFVLFLCFLVPVLRSSGQVIFKSARNANYWMVVSWDENKKQIQGNTILTWRNITHRPTRELQFHLYMNAFKNNRSTRVLEGDGYARKLEREKAWGWIDVDRISIGAKDLTQRIEFINPDDDNRFDQTVIRVELDKPVRPGEEITVSMDFTTQLPIVYVRNGYYKDFVFASQWFPKIGVLEDAGWNCHQFHRNTEFYADYGVYDVRLTLPKSYVLGSTGTLQSVEEDSVLKIHVIHAEDVHDFAWTAWPHYRIAEQTHRNVKIILLYEKDHKAFVDLTLEAMNNTMDYLGDWLGEYPYPNITVVHGPTGCGAVNGMEYPMFVTGGAYWGLPAKVLNVTAMVTVHEFGHNWFYGMVGNNEFEEAWLDEGINSYAEARIMDHFYGDENSMIDLLGLRIGELAFQRMGYLPERRWDRTLRPGWTYIGGGYGSHSYMKPALMLRTLENVLGKPVMDRIMRSYFQRWKFKHPKSRDFIDVVNEISKGNYDWFFDQVLSGSDELDYAIGSVFTGMVLEKKGLFDDGEGKIVYPLEKKKAVADSARKKDPPAMYRSTVKVRRKGEVVIPVDVLLVFENGDSLGYSWDGQERWAKYVVEKDAKLEYAVVDPERKLVIDSNFSNNSMTVKARKEPVHLLAARALYWFESVLAVFGFFG